MHKLTYRLLISMAMAALTSVNAIALSTTYYSDTTPLASGKWIKIKVSNTGMQQITYDQLRAWGFSNPEKVAVYGFGGISLTDNTFSTSTPDGLPATPVIQTDNKIIFYGEADKCATNGVSATTVNYRRNVYSNYGYYFLTDSQTPAKATEVAYSEQNGKLTTHYAVQMIDNDVQSPSTAGSIFHDKELTKGTPQTYTFDVADYVSSLRLDCRYGINSSNSMKLSFTFSDGITVGTQEDYPPAIIPTNYNYQIGTANVSLTPDDTSDRTVSVGVDLVASATYAAIDRIWMSYIQANRLGNDSQRRMNFITDNVKSYNNILIEAPTESMYLWDVTDPFNIRQCNTSAVTYNEENYLGASFDLSSGITEKRRSLIAFKPGSSMYEVEYVGPVVNQNIHGDSTPEMLIITTDVLKASAETLAGYHRTYQNMDVAIYTNDEIMNEFSSGTNSAMGYRRLAKMFYDRDPQKFKYLLLYGVGSWDNRHLVTGDKGQLLTYQAESDSEVACEATAYGADSYFGMLSDNFTTSTISSATAQVAVGRIPAEDTGDALSYNIKCLKYLTTRPDASVYNRAILISDSGDKNAHFTQSMEIADVITGNAPSVTTYKAANAIYPTTNDDAVTLRSVVTKALDLGSFYFTYSGHGSWTAFSGSNVWTRALAKNQTYKYMPIAMFATCSSFPYDRQTDNIGAAFLYNTDGGAIAIVGAGRSVYLEYNQYINSAMADALYSATSTSRIGDVYLKARNVATAESNRTSVGLNTLCYNLGGDPALPVYVPNYKVNFLTVNKTAASDTIEIAPLAANTIEGEITDSKGNRISDFNGTVTLTLYDGPTEVTISDSTDGSTFDETILTEVVANVVNGAFTTTLTAPMPQTPNSTNRLSAAAQTDDLSSTAVGVCKTLSIVESNDVTSTDTTAPTISEIYVDNETFTNGDVVRGSATTFYAKIDADESGLNTSGSAIGAGPRLTLDNSTTYSLSGYIAGKGDGTAEINYPLSGLTDGIHTLSLSIADNAGNRTTSLITFVIETASESEGTLEIGESVARTVATISLNGVESSDYNRLTIMDRKGNVVINRENISFPYEWDLKDSEGNKVADGQYSAHAIFSSGSSYGSTPKANILVLKQTGNKIKIE